MNDFDKYIDIYVHVDDIATRDKEVDLISKMIGVKINPFDWSKADRDTGCNYQTHDIEIKDCPVVPSKYEDFYYRTMNRIPGSQAWLPEYATGRYPTTKLLEIHEVNHEWSTGDRKRNRD